MFQYAFGKSLAKEKNQKLIIDTSFLDCRIPVKGFTVRNYELGLFGISESITKSFSSKLLSEYVAYPLQKVQSIIDNGYIVEGTNPYFYDGSIVERILSFPGDITLEGFWNNPLYFEKFNEALHEIYDSVKLYDEKYESIESDIKNSNSVSISIRRGDYLNNKHKDIYVYLDKDYYQRAIDIIKKKIQNPKFYVFSYDDPDWLKNQLDFSPEELEIVGKNYTGDRFKSYLRLLSMCKHNIISNSTFSFWGAWMNKNPQANRIGPKKWSHAYNFYYPSSWTSI
jgi:hypothetical protein